MKQFQNFTNKKQKFCEQYKWLNIVKYMLNYQNTQLNKLKSATKSQTGVTLRMNIKISNGNNLPKEFLLTTRQKTEEMHLKLKCQLI